MKRLIALLTAIAFTLTLGAAFAQEGTDSPAAPEKKVEKSPVKKKHARKHKKHEKKAETQTAPESK